MEEKIWNCIVRRLNGTETPDSENTLDLWLANSAANQQQYQQAKEIWALSADLETEAPEVPFNAFVAQLKPKPTSRPKTITLFWKYGIAAAITMIFLGSGLYYYKSEQSNNKQLNWTVKRAGLGQMIKIDLPDSSTVWLNSGSQISFASRFSDQPLRLVKLKGEAYFQVKHDSKHPFVVESGKLTTTVYGTSFNVRAYENESATAVAVNSGKVGVLRTGQLPNEPPIMLLPNDQLTFNSKSKSWLRSAIDSTDVNAWTDGELVFEQSAIEDVAKVLSRKYKVAIDASHVSRSGCKLTARFKNQPIQVILNALKLSLHIQSTQVKQTIYLRGGNCM